MNKFFAAIKKETLLIWRDKLGMLLLFILPACLIIFISLTQPDFSKPENIKLLLIDKEHGAIAKAIDKGLQKASDFDVTRENKYSFKQARQAVAIGDYDMALVIPSSTTKSITRHTEDTLLKPRKKARAAKRITLYFNPDLPEAARQTIVLAINSYVQGIKTEIMTNILSRALRQPPPQDSLHKNAVASKTVKLDPSALRPNAVQQNVPAWTLFGIFMIIIPLSTMMVKEREQSVMQRLQIAPVWRLNLLFGRVTTFVALNMIQMTLMFAVGVYVVPHFDLPTLNLMDNLGQAALIGLCASFASIGMSILVGTWVRTHEQASTVGPFLIIIMASIGGVFTPYDMVPANVQHIAEYISPLQWAQHAYLKTFVHNASLAAISPMLIKLLVFGLACLLISLIKVPHYRSKKKAAVEAKV